MLRKQEKGLARVKTAIATPFVFILILPIFLFYKIVYFFKKLSNRKAARAKLAVVQESKDKDLTIEDQLNQMINFSGFQYDSKQDMFYSAHDAWQKKYGYCRLYDEIAGPWGMIVDSEPIYFQYAGKSWLIEFWKGQYDLTTGCEMGIYATEQSVVNIPGVFNNTFYNSGDEEDKLEMSFSLIKNGKELFKGKDKHWWLTGFKLGEFSQPWELKMEIGISLKDDAMCNAFIEGLKNAGYSDGEIMRYGNTVGFIFGEPKTPQPMSRIKTLDSIIQKKNKYMCDKYQELTGSIITMLDKLVVLSEQAPELYEKIEDIGKLRKI